MPYSQRGYLSGDYRLFRLRDRVSLNEIDYHTHEFHKLLLFRGGTAGYSIEGRHYPLLPGDLVLVPQGCVHRPEADGSSPYSRDVLYLSPAFLREGELDSCFLRARAENAFVLRLPKEEAADLERQFRALEEAESEPEAFASALLGRLLTQRLLISVCRAMQRSPAAPESPRDGQTAQILQYIRENLTGDVSADALAAKFYVSKYHLMRTFKAETGYSLHQYVSGKRLLYARELLDTGFSPSEACFRCGYQDYSAFARAYKKQFGVPPRG